MIKIQSHTLKRVSPRRRKDWKFLDGGCGQSYEVFSTLSAPPNLGARVTSRKFLNGQTAGKSRDRRAGYILEKGLQCISENTSGHSWLKAKLMVDQVNRGKSKGCV